MLSCRQAERGRDLWGSGKGAPTGVWSENGRTETEEVVSDRLLEGWEGQGACVVSRGVWGRGRGSAGRDWSLPVLRAVCFRGQFIRRWPLGTGFVGAESLRVQRSGMVSQGLWPTVGGVAGGRGLEWAWSFGKPPGPAPGKLFLGRGGGQVRSRGGRGVPGRPRPYAGVRRQLTSCGVRLQRTAEPSGAMPTNFTVVPVEARADGAGDEAAERTEEPGSPESADPACPTSGELGGTCRGTKAEAGPSRRRWAALARGWQRPTACSGAMGRGQEGQPVPAWLRGGTRDPERILGLVVCWRCSFRP